MFRFSLILGAMHTIGGLTDCDNGEADTHSMHIPQNEDKGSINNNHDMSRQNNVTQNITASDTLTNLPLNVLECIVGYLSVIDTLITCHTSPLINE